MKRPNPMLIDEENPEWTDAMFADARPASEVLRALLPEATAEALLKPRKGRPKVEYPKVPLTMRIDANTLAGFKATGRGWQTRMNEALKEWLKTHSAA